MRMLDLFSGIGGFALAAQWVWGESLDIVSFCEIDPFCRKVLKKHWPDVPCCDDIKTLDGAKYEGTVDIVSGGFPCQPASINGKRHGAADDRWLWPDMCRIINAVRPRWVLIENVANLVRMEEFDELADDMEASSYETVVFVIPAFAVGAEHLRERVWVAAHDTRLGMEGNWPERVEVPHALAQPLLPLRNSHGQWKVEPDFRRANDGLSFGLAKDRLKAMGNAIVPQIAEVFFRAIKEIDNGQEGPCLVNPQAKFRRRDSNGRCRVSQDYHGGKKVTDDPHLL